MELWVENRIEMNKIQTWKYKKQWHACRIFADDKIIARYTVSVYGTGKTKSEAISSLCEALITLSEEIRSVVHEVNINK